jgi:serine/threonine-protein kinase
VNLIGRSIGNYVVRSELGRGAHGVVYLAEHAAVGRQVALKVLHLELAIPPEMVERLYHEAKAAGHVAAEHGVEVLDFGSLDVDGRATAYLAMELLLGQDLGRRASSAALSVGESLDIARQCCAALAAAHRAGIVHCDLTPKNIFVSAGEGGARCVKLLGFGIVKLVGDPSTRAGTALLGTPAYMSPEQRRGSDSVDHRSDIYSLGAILYRLLSGQPPVDARDRDEEPAASLAAEPAAPSRVNPHVTPALDAVILRALAQAPGARFQSMDEMAEAIARAQRALPDPAPHPAGADPAPRPPGQPDTMSGAPTDADPRPLRPPGTAASLFGRVTFIKEGAASTASDLHDDATLIKHPPTGSAVAGAATAGLRGLAAAGPSTVPAGSEDPTAVSPRRWRGWWGLGLGAVVAALWWIALRLLR